MHLYNKTKDFQSMLADYCRTGSLPVTLGVNADRVHHYRRMVYNIVDDSLRSAYPLTCNLLEEEEWDALIDEFFTKHPCQSPQVWYMPKELYYYILEVAHPLTEKYPFLGELLWFEWLEVEMYMQEDKNAAFTAEGGLEDGRLVLNPEHHVEHFYYPVHLKNARQIKEEDFGSHYLVLHRVPDTGKVEFMQLSPAFVRMIELLNEEPLSVAELLDKIATEFDVALSKEIIESTVDFMQVALDKRLILGYKVD
jgi:hypothetical protein